MGLILISPLSTGAGLSSPPSLEKKKLKIYHQCVFETLRAAITARNAMQSTEKNGFSKTDEGVGVLEFIAVRQCKEESMQMIYIH